MSFNLSQGSILHYIDKAHEVGFGNGPQKVEKILMDDQYLNRKSGSLQNMQFEMFNNLLNNNILSTKDMFLTETHPSQYEPQNEDYENELNSKVIPNRNLKLVDSEESEYIEPSIYSDDEMSQRSIFLHNARTREDRLPAYLNKRLKSKMKKRPEDKDYDSNTLQMSLSAIRKKVHREKQNHLSTVSTQI